MFCMKCGGELLENAKFCLNCGAPVEQSAAVLAEQGAPAVNTPAPIGNAAAPVESTPDIAADMSAAQPEAPVSVPAVQDIPEAVNVPVTELALTCPKCSAAMPAGAKMCGICGSALAELEPEPVTTRLPAEPAPHFQPVNRAVLMQHTIPDAGATAAVKPRAASSKRNIIILVVALAVVIVGAVFAVLAMGSGESGDAAETLTLAQRYLSEENYEQAVIEFERLLEIDPKNTEAYLGLAEAYKALGEHDKAAKALEQALSEVGEEDKQLIQEAISELDAVIVETEDSAESTTAVTTKEQTTTAATTTTAVGEETGEPAQQEYISFEDAIAAAELIKVESVFSAADGLYHDHYYYDLLWDDGIAYHKGDTYQGYFISEAVTILYDNVIEHIYTEWITLDVNMQVECYVKHSIYPITEESEYHLLLDGMQISDGSQMPVLREQEFDLYARGAVSELGVFSEPVRCRADISTIKCINNFREAQVDKIEILEEAEPPEIALSPMEQAFADEEPVRIIADFDSAGNSAYVYDFVWRDEKLESGSVYEGYSLYYCETWLVNNDVDDVWRESFDFRIDKFYDGVIAHDEIYGGFYFEQLSVGSDSLPFWDGATSINVNRNLVEDLDFSSGSVSCNVLLDVYSVTLEDTSHITDYSIGYSPYISSTVSGIQFAETEVVPTTFAEAVAMSEPTGTRDVNDYSDDWFTTGDVYDFVWLDNTMIKDGDEYMGLTFSDCETVVADGLDVLVVSFKTKGTVEITGEIGYYEYHPEHDCWIYNVDTSVLPFHADYGSDIGLSSNSISLEDYHQSVCKVTIDNFEGVFTPIHGGYFADVTAIQIIE